jgi:hypothetical protein
MCNCSVCCVRWDAERCVMLYDWDDEKGPRWGRRCNIEPTRNKERRWD